MLSGATLSAAAMVGTAVFRIVVSSDSMKNATATSHGNSRLLDGAHFHEVTVADSFQCTCVGNEKITRHV